MANPAWSRNEKIALISLLFVAISSIAAIIVVPEIRNWLGLDASMKALKGSNKNANSPNMNQAENSPPIPNANSSSPVANAQPKVIKRNGLSFTPNVSSRFYYVDRWRDATTLQVQILDMSLYDDQKMYIKLSFCNVADTGIALYEWYIWYTPSSRQDSINWSWNENPLMSLKPGACKTIGGWSERADDSFSLARPLGVLNISPDGNKILGTIDLNAADSQGFIHF